MIDRLKHEKYDFVFASRYEKNCGSDDDTIVTLIGNYIFTFLGKLFFRLEITDILYTYVMARTSCAKSLDLSAKDFSFCVELPIKAKELATKFVQANRTRERELQVKRKLMHSEMV